MGSSQDCRPDRSARRADIGPDPRHRYRYQRQRLLCRDAFALCHRNRSARGTVDWDGKGFDTRPGSHQRSESWYGNRIRRFENREPATASGPSPGHGSLQLLNRAPYPELKKSTQLERSYLGCLIEAAICSWSEVARWRAPEKLVSAIEISGPEGRLSSEMEDAVQDCALTCDLPATRHDVAKIAICPIDSASRHYKHDR